MTGHENEFGHSEYCRAEKPDCICTRCRRDKRNGLCGERDLSEYRCPVTKCPGFLAEKSVESW